MKISWHARCKVKRTHKPNMNTTRSFALFFTAAAFAAAVALLSIDNLDLPIASAFEILASLTVFVGFAFVVARDFGPLSVAQGVKLPASAKPATSSRPSSKSSASWIGASRTAHRAPALAATRRTERALIEMA